jgi:pimeloyl-ACP methyl ester carboxylesterase
VFSLDPIKAEEQFVKMLDEWRAAIGLNEPFILLGHSFGGFVSAAYALRHPAYVKQLVLIDPWGFGRRPKNIWQTGRLQRVPTWLRSFSGIIMKLSPLAGLRAAGPLGKYQLKDDPFQSIADL